MGEFEQAVSIHELYPVFLMEGDELEFIACLAPEELEEHSSYFAETKLCWSIDSRMSTGWSSVNMHMTFDPDTGTGYGAILANQAN